ncbi:alpha-galactosidase [Pedobacter sp. WC2501]|uniref:alpha-galactosidase n=1 Tax=Pedobacter sp. WC2501 TaxID=3461400 RepID=UPI004045E44A
MTTTNCFGKPLLNEPDYHSISNEILRVEFNEKTHRVSFLSGNRKPIIYNAFEYDHLLFKNIRPVYNKEFGKGHSIILTRDKISYTVITLYDGIPFFFINDVIKNGSNQIETVEKHDSGSFPISLNFPSNQLVTMGTGGLRKPDDNPGSYLFLTVAEPKSLNGIVAGCLTHDRGDGVLFSKVQNGQVVLKMQVDYGRLPIPVHASIATETFVLGYFTDARKGQELFADLLSRQYHIKLKDKSATYCTWYDEFAGKAGTESSIKEISEFARKELKPFGFGGIQIDDGWQGGPVIDGPARGFEAVNPNGPYAKGLGDVGKLVNKNGFRFGLWWMPFGRNDQAPEYTDKQNWFARKKNGELFRVAKFGGTCLDLTRPEVKENIKLIVNNMKRWDVNYFKMDGLWTGTATEINYINDGYKDDHMENISPFYDTSKTQIESFRDGLKLIRNTAGKDVFISGCAISQNMRSLGGAIGLVDAMRVGPDYNHDKQGIKTGPIRASRLYFLNGKVWWNDPDPVKVRASNAVGSADAASSGKATLSSARLAASFVSLANDFFLLSDYLPHLPKDRLEILKRTMDGYNAEIRPIDYFENNIPNFWEAHQVQGHVHRHLIGMFNWENGDTTLSISLKKGGLASGRSYYGFDFWSDKLLPVFKDVLTMPLAAQSCAIVSLRPVQTFPQVISTSRHISQGMTDLANEIWSAKSKTLSGKSEVIGNDSYEIRVVCPQKNYHPRSVAVSPKDEGLGVKTSIHQEGDLVRIKITSPVTRVISWKANFFNTTSK